jgi:hypothetical protein
LVGVQHRTAQETAERLTELLGITLSPITP